MSNENVLLKEKRSYLFNLWTLYVIKISQVVSYQELILWAVLILLFCHYIPNVYIVLIKLNKRSLEGGNPI